MSAFPADLDKCVRRSSKHEKHLRREIHKAHRAGKKKRTRQAVYRYLQSYDAKLAAGAEAYRDLKQHQRPKVDLLPGIAENLDPFVGTDEDVFVVFKEKSDGNFRPIMQFGIRNRALQIMARHILGAQADLLPNQFAIRGGIRKAIERVVKNLNDGFRHTAEIDLSNCYGSFDEEGVVKVLPLPERVTRRILLSCSLSLVGSNLHQSFGPVITLEDKQEVEDVLAEDMAAARLGIPQGSAVSPLVAEMLLAPVIASVPKIAPVVVYADNILVMARDENDLASMSTALFQSTKNSPVGQLWPKVVASGKPGESFDFVGHRLIPASGGYRVEPSEKNFKQFDLTFAQAIAVVGDGARTLEKRQHKAKHLKRFVRSWCAAFACWEEQEKFRGLKFFEVEQALNGDS